VDASALVDALARNRRSEAVRMHLQSADAVAAPELLLVEVASALWRLVRAGAINDSDARRGIDAVATMDVELVPHRALLPQAWAFRESVRIGDAFYLACAARLGTSLLTTDARLARGHHGVPTTLVS